MSFIKNLNWRYATKEFDGRKISEENLNKILEAIRLAPSSFGIQPYRITVVGNDEIKKNLNSHAFWDQKQIATCSHALVFNDDLDFPKRANDFVALAEREGRDDITNDPEFDYAKEAADYAVRMCLLVSGMFLTLFPTINRGLILMRKTESFLPKNTAI